MSTNQPARTIKKIGVIVPTASTSKTAQRDIDQHCFDMLARAASAYSKRNIELEIHLTGNRKANNAIRTEARKYHNVTTRTHTPDFHKTSTRNGNANEIHRTNGRIAAEIDGLLVIKGNKPSLTSQDREIIANAKKRGKTIGNRTVSPTPTPKDLQPELSGPILPESAYRVNLRKFKDLEALMADHATHGLADGQKPIYCGAPNAKTNGQGSPLENRDRFKKNSLDLYRAKLWELMQTRDPAVMRELRMITPTTPLICYCHSRKPCHTDIIRDAAAWLKTQDTFDESSAYIENRIRQAENNASPTRCTATTRTGSQCKRNTRTGSTCYAHTPRKEKAL